MCTTDTVLVRPNCKMKKIGFMMSREILVWLTTFYSSLHKNVERIDRVKSTKNKSKNPKHLNPIFCLCRNWKSREMGHWGFPYVGLSAAKEKPRGLIPNSHWCVAIIISY